MPHLHLKRPKFAERTAARSTASAPQVTHHPGPSSPALDLLSLQHVAGNQAVTRLLAPHNADEREAEHEAYQVMNHAPTQGPQVIQSLPSAATLPTSDALVNQPGPGMPLPSVLRVAFEERLGHDLGQVRIHSGIQAAMMARGLKAQAFTMGNTIVFGNGKYEPDTTAGKALLAHELTHVIQQSSGAGLAPSPMSEVKTEREAQQVSQAVVYGQQPVSVAQQSGVGIARQAAGDDELQFIVPSGRYAAATEKTIPLDERPELKPKLGVGESRITEEDASFQGTEGARFKAIVAEAAQKVDIDPGLLAATLLAEETRSVFTSRTGETDSFVIGADDFFEKRREIEALVPAARTIPRRFQGTDTNEQGRSIDTITFSARDAALIDAAYLKYSEIRARFAFASQGGDFDALPVEVRFALTRYGMNAGLGALEKQVKRIIAGGTPIPRTGSSKPGAAHPLRTAVIHAAQAIHLSQKIFGTPPAYFELGLR